MAQFSRTAYLDCPLIEIVHFHECLRGELRSLHANVQRLRAMIDESSTVSEDSLSLEMQVQSQFKLLHAVFQAHSTAEDETIWPALKKKAMEAADQRKSNGPGNGGITEQMLNENDYIEDHEDEERFFCSMEEILGALRKVRGVGDPEAWSPVLYQLETVCATTTSHLLDHLLKEERHALPLVRSHLSTQEMEELVGHIMGKRPSELMQTILSMMQRNLPKGEWSTMLGHMQRAVNGTYFEKWLAWGGFRWPGSDRKMSQAAELEDTVETKEKEDGKCCCSLGKTFREVDLGLTPPLMAKQSSSPSSESLGDEKSGCDHVQCSDLCRFLGRCPGNEPLTQEELSKVVRRVSAVGGSATRKSRLLQQVQQHQWMMHAKNKKVHGNGERADGNAGAPQSPSNPAPAGTRRKRPREENLKEDFSRTYVGCAHYQRKVMVQAFCCGSFHPCRLCHDQEKDHIMDRYKIQIMKCMTCYREQPANRFCENQKCRFHKEPLSRYYCNICKLFDDDPNKEIYHCPYCNICRLGRGLGHDFRHCMKCNCCINLSVQDHNCLPKALEGNCPICNEALFTSTSEYKGLKCGHLMHLDCYKKYISQAHEQLFWFRCPVCRKTMDDMTEYFSQLDAVVAAQPMPEDLSESKADIQCLDCEMSSVVAYHFLYQKCPNCGSYNTQVKERSNSFGSG